MPVCQMHLQSMCTVFLPLKKIAHQGNNTYHFSVYTVLLLFPP
jgi:hypothetical protein